MVTTTNTLTLFTPFFKLQTLPSLHRSLRTHLLTLQPTKPRTLQISCCSSQKPSKNLSSLAEVDNLRVVFAAGGTGSHVYPAVGIAEELKMANPTCRFLFIGTSNSMESSAIPSEGYPFISVPSIISHNPLFFPYNLVNSLIQCFHQLQHFQPHVVIGTGGHVSFPICLAAKLKGIKLVIHEQNSVPCLTNTFLSFFADVIFVAFNSTVNSFFLSSIIRKKCVVCGNPVRLSLRNNDVSKVDAMSHFFPGYGKTSDSSSDKVLLVLGGSFGANAVNIAMLNLYYQMLRHNSCLFIIWQTGVEAYDEMDSLVRDHPRLYMKPFMHRMNLAYAAADLIVSRAGAMTCYEILAIGKPSILIPSPNFSEGNQFRNASLMADLAGVKVITEDELDSSTLAIAIEQILRDEKKMEDVSDRALKAANPNASAEIAKHILSIVNLSTKKEEMTRN